VTRRAIPLGKWSLARSRLPASSWRRFRGERQEEEEEEEGPARHRRPLVPVHRRAAGSSISARRFHMVAVPAELTLSMSALQELHWRSERNSRTGCSPWGSRQSRWSPRASTGSRVRDPRGTRLGGRTRQRASTRRRTVPGRKTDVNDAQWIQQLHSYGLLRASFRPGAEIVALRAYMRHRERMLEYGGVATSNTCRRHSWQRTCNCTT